MVSKTAVIFDYGFGNVRSVERAIEHLGVQAVVTSDYQESLNADYLIVPGVGNFGECMRGLLKAKGDELIHKRYENEQAVLGICVGHQILFNGSKEADDICGLGIISGQSEKLQAKIVPHMGWNTIDSSTNNFNLMKSYIGEAFYFVHSYAVLNCTPNAANLVSQTTDYQKAITKHENCEFISAVQLGSVTGFQFHPEKSGEVGLSLLESYFKDN